MIRQLSLAPARAAPPCRQEPESPAGRSAPALSAAADLDVCDGQAAVAGLLSHQLVDRAVDLVEDVARSPRRAALRNERREEHAVQQAGRERAVHHAALAQERRLKVDRGGGGVQSVQQAGRERAVHHAALAQERRLEVDRGGGRSPVSPAGGA